MKKLILMLMLFAPMALFAQKFGHLNTQQVMNDMPEFVKARGEIEATAKQYENDLKAMQEELQRKASEYDKTKSTMNATKQKETEESLMQLNEKIRTAYQDNSQALQKAQQEDAHSNTRTALHVKRIELLGFVPSITSLYKAKTVDGCIA